MLTKEDLKNIEELFKPKFDQIEQRLDKIDQRLDQSDHHHEQHGRRFKSIDQQFKEFRQEMDQKFIEQNAYIYRCFQNQTEVFKQIFVTKDEFERFKQAAGFAGYVSDKSKGK